jgi:hypothetical protein
VLLTSIGQIVQIKTNEAKINMRYSILTGLVFLTQFYFANLCQAQTVFQDDFEGDLSRWQLVGALNITIKESNSGDHGRVMELEPNGKVLALIPGSDAWGPLRLELDMLFPDDAHNYLGFIYHYTDSGHRTDFGSLYVKGNGSYIRANPWRDGNVSRLLYEEYKIKIEGKDAIRIGAWQRVMLEVDGENCHLYIGDMKIPKITFNLYEGRSGLVGFNPRVAGHPVWIDNVRATAIKALSYKGPDLPAISYSPENLLTAWQVAGPYVQPIIEIEEKHAHENTDRTNEEPNNAWRPFSSDARGALVTGRISEYEGNHPVVYLKTLVHSRTDKNAILHLSTLDEISLWVNDTYHGFVYRNGYMFGNRDWNAWHDFYKNPSHEGSKVPIKLKAGENQILLRVRNGQFASGGLFARLEEIVESEPQK